MSENEKSKEFGSMLERFDIVADGGFNLQVSKHNPSEGPAGESYEFLLSNGADILMEFKFYPATSDKSDYVVVYVIDSKADRDFGLDAWLQKRNGASKQSPFMLSNYSGTYEQQLIGFEKFVDKLFYEPELRDVLEGKAWVDVSFNWGGAK